MEEPAASASRCSGSPDWVDTVAHKGRCRDNVTTAVAETSAGCPIEVSFVVADPPALTRCVVHCPDLTATEFLKAPPCITGADGAFLLVLVIFPRRNDRSQFIDVFVYRAGPGAPLLRLLPRPYPADLISNHIGVLHCGGGDSSEHCLVVVLQRQLQVHDAGRFVYSLHVFSIETTSWSTKVARLLAPDMAAHHVSFHPTKVLAIDGGSLTWVDFRRGILLCNSVADDPEVRLIRMPPLMPINSVEFRVDSDGIMPPLDGIRDVTSRNGCFRVIEMGFLQLDAGSTGQYSFGWTASIFKSMIASENWELEPCRTVDSTNLLLANSCLPCLIPEIWDCKENKLIMNNVISTFPTLDLYRDDVFYMVTKMKGADPNSWVIAVNAESKKLEKIVPFSAERSHFRRTVLRCAFSKHLSKASRNITDGKYNDIDGCL